MKYFYIPAFLLLPIYFSGCQSGSEEDKSIASTHPKLEEQLATDSVKTPITSKENPDLYGQYRITLEEFEQSKNYHVPDMYRGRLAPLDEASHTDARTYSTALKRGLEKGVNFAGKYTVVTVGCGTSCQTHFVIDRESGKVLDKIESAVGATYNSESRLFIINPPDSTINYNDCRNCMPQAYVFKAGKFTKIEMPVQQP